MSFKITLASTIVFLLSLMMYEFTTDIHNPVELKENIVVPQKQVIIQYPDNDDDEDGNQLAEYLNKDISV